MTWGRNEKSYPAGSKGHRVIRSVTYAEAKLKGLSDRSHICGGCEKGKDQERFLGLQLEEMSTGRTVYWDGFWEKQRKYCLSRSILTCLSNQRPVYPTYTSLELCEWSQVKKKSGGPWHTDGHTQVTKNSTDKEEWRIEEELWSTQHRVTGQKRRNQQECDEDSSGRPVSCLRKPKEERDGLFGVGGT